MKPSDLARFIDHTLLKAEAREPEIRMLCQEAVDYGFFSVCVNSTWVSLAKSQLRDSQVKICSVVGFPLGAMETEAKVYETERALSLGADEIDMVISIGALKSGDFNFVESEISKIAAKTKGHILKVILEISLLTSEEIESACHLSVQAGAQFVKTSTGFSQGGASLESVRQMRKLVGPLYGVKASGGIRNFTTARAMLDAGANRLGTSQSIAIITDKDSSEGAY